MKLRFRLILLFFTTLFRKPNSAISNGSVLRFRVMPSDCVLFRVGNDRYHAFMDIGRIDLAIRSGWWKIVVQNKWNPFVITVHIRHNASLKMFQRFVLRTRPIHWDSRYIWMEHIFERKGKTVATAISKNAAIGKNGIVSSSLILRLFTQELEFPIGKDQIVLTNAMEECLRNIH